MSKRDAAEASRYAELLNEIAENLAAQMTQIPLTLPTPTNDPTTAAKQTRIALQIPSNEPIPHLMNAIERAGVLILALPAPLPGRDAFMVWIQRQQNSVPAIAISRDRPGDRLRLNLAHELGHIVMRHSPRPDRDQEKLAYSFAAELLMPELAMRRELVVPITLSSLAVLKPKWRISIQALIRRAYDLHLIGDRQYRYLFEQLSTKGWRTAEPANLNIPVEKPRALRQMAELLYGQPIDFARMAADLHLGSTFLREVLQQYAEPAAADRNPTNSSGRVISFAKS